MISTFLNTVNARLGRYFPEQRIYLKTESDMRYVRLTPFAQISATTILAFLFLWLLFSTTIVLIEATQSSGERDQSGRQQRLFEQRLSALSQDLNLRTNEAVSAQKRFNKALAQVSQMQTNLLASDDQLREFETGIDVIQNTLRRAIKERDAARAETKDIKAKVKGPKGVKRSIQEIADDAQDSLYYMAEALESAALNTGTLENEIASAEEMIANLEHVQAGTNLRNELILARLEEAVELSTEPLRNMFSAVGLDADVLLDQVRDGYLGQGGPLISPALEKLGDTQDGLINRAQLIVNGFDTLNLYAIAIQNIPFGIPLQNKYRLTSSFGIRTDPKEGGKRMHEGTDFASGYGAPIYAPADGNIIYANWESGYGRLIKISHKFGIETRYGHLSQLRVKVGQKVSRGERIGDMGNSGRSTGTHLHYEVRMNGTPVNPMTFIRAAKNVF